MTKRAREGRENSAVIEVEIRERERESSIMNEQTQ